MSFVLFKALLKNPACVFFQDCLHSKSMSLTPPARRKQTKIGPNPISAFLLFNKTSLCNCDSVNEITFSADMNLVSISYIS